MRCPKCGYISFDYNMACPKCNKDISGEQKKLNLPPFMPDPPALLAALTGEAGDSQLGLHVGGMADTLKLEHLPEVSITEPEEVEIELKTEGSAMGEEDVVGFDLEKEELKGLAEQDLGGELSGIGTQDEGEALDLDTAEMVTQEVGKAGEEKKEDLGEFDFELELEEIDEDKT
ncbi:MAG: hypothetical protein DRG63_11820 [Deltaproteobacteria bacterium]|nr:MAG: hypothetical protein DRG63_11820 [Deltaproteobacteria bacterium]